MQKPLNTNLPADLPENWQIDDAVSPSGTDVGLTAKHGYNYQSKQINEAHKAINALNEAFTGVQGNLEALQTSTTIVDGDSVPVVQTDGATKRRITFTNLVAAIGTKLATVFAAIAHSHGNITNDGKLGSVGNQVAITGSDGTLRAGTAPIEGGGTGASTAAGARTNLGITPENIGAAKTVHKHSASDIETGTLPVARGGTGVTTLAIGKLKTDASSDTFLNVYLSPSGNDTATGLSTSVPMKSIRAAVAKYGGLNRVRLNLAAGTYTDTAVVVISGNCYVDITGTSTPGAVVITHPIIFESTNVKAYQVTFDLTNSAETYPGITVRQAKYDIQNCVFRGKAAVHAGINVSLGSSGYIYQCTFQSGIRAVEIGSGAIMTALESSVAAGFEIGFNVNGGILLANANTNNAATKFTMYNSAVIFNDGQLLNPITSTVAQAELV